MKAIKRRRNTLARIIECLAIETNLPTLDKMVIISMGYS